MGTPDLTKTQQRKSLSSKKGPSKGLKNVLAQPNDNNWPLLKHDHGAVLEKLLTKLLPVLKRSENKVPWAELRKMTKEERGAARRAAQVDGDDNYDTEAAKSIVFGINKVTKLLEKDELCCILLDATVDPMLLVKHIITMGQNNKVPVLLISFLKRVTLETIGFGCAAVGLKSHVLHAEDNYFRPLVEKVSELVLELPSPTIPAKLFQDDSTTDISLVDHSNVQNEKQQVKSVAKPVIVSTDNYLYRTSTTCRAFIPLNSSKPKVDDFIALDDEEFTIDVNVPLRFFHSANTNNHKNIDKTTKFSGKLDKTKCNKDTVSYKPLKVKRLQGNVSRTKATRPPKVKKK